MPSAEHEVHHAPGMGGVALRDELAQEPGKPPPRDLLTSVARAFEVLELVALAPEPIPVKAIASTLGISLGTAYHVVHTLEHGGYVVRLGQGRFGLGTKVGELSRVFSDRVDVLPVARLPLDDLAAQANEDAYLAVMRAGEVVVAEVIEGSASLHCGDLGVGFAQVAHSTALGKVLLAGTPSTDVDRYLAERRLSRLTANTLIDRRHIKRNLRAVSDLGIARDLEEFSDGVCCVACPVVDGDGDTIASIGVSVPSRRWRRDHERLTQMCRDSAQSVSQELLAAGLSLPASERLAGKSVRPRRVVQRATS